MDRVLNLLMIDAVIFCLPTQKAIAHCGFYLGFYLRTFPQNIKA